ncbi:MAG TPA: nitrogenase cofactor biosynthesis protein NifB [Syntrophomonas sp.]|nr:nitrogenase cofactor biosynthesis protein NifB [Syntrophomonas sp.]
MSMNLVNLNVNPCKMCMPMGSVSAFYGIRHCMTLLHGSQGCSTYIRRHMATHYNEPVDIASSSLTEQGTVFGGEENLIKGLENLIALYDPEVIGVATTCLAETIGEDLPRMIRDFYAAHSDCRAKIIPVSSAGYSGTQYEGFFTALHAIVAHTEMNTAKHDKINVITGMLSPADTRYLKNLLGELGLQAILLPDLSDNLDGGHQRQYQRLPEGGTTLAEIAQMAGARLTVEIASFVNENYSPARYLYDTYGVPYIRCHLPVSLQDSDELLRVLVEEAGGRATENILRARARYLDAMVDSHKYNAEGRAAIFGEPDFVYAVTRMCTENGIVPVLVATGAKCEKLAPLLVEEIRCAAAPQFVKRFEILDDCDFDTIEDRAMELGANLLIGNSDGRRIEHKLGIPLIRCAFPIHDHVGGQRVRTIGYEGALTLLDRCTNALISRKEEGYRENQYQKYYQGLSQVWEVIPGDPKRLEAKTIQEKTASHPCFNGCGGSYARLHLPVARECNIQCNYCLRKYDCPNESRPGVATRLLTPAEALERYKEAREKIPRLTVVGIAGPGDALADFDKTQKTLQMIRMIDPEVTFCLSTNGLMLPQYVEQIVELGVSHVTVTVNAVDVKIAAPIYQHIRYMGETYTGETAAAILLANQLAGIRMLVERDIIVKVNIVMLKDVNEEHIPAVVEKMKSLGVTLTNIMQLIPVKGSKFENMPLVSNKEIMQMRKQCGQTLTQMMHCRQCRADAAGTLDHDIGGMLTGVAIEAVRTGGEVACARRENTAAVLQPKPLLLAVSSRSGVLVDQHFGQASDFYIYACSDGEVRFMERRGVGKYCDRTAGCDNRGGGSNKQYKFEEIYEAVKDCACVVTMRIGDTPRAKLAEKGIAAFMSFGRIEDAVREAAAAYRENKMEGIM